MKKQFIAFLESQLKEVDNAKTQKDKHHDFDMAFGGAWLLLNFIDPDNFKTYDEIWNEYHAKFYEKGCLKND